MSKIRVVSFGLGPIGLRAAQLAHQRKGIELVGAIDIDPAKTGKDLGDFFSPSTKTGITIEADADAAFDRLKPDAVLHCTSSFMPVVKDQLVAIAKRGIDIISSTEELLLPDLQHPDIAKVVDAAALAGGATVLGTGVNPGFAMDFIAVVASAVTYSVRRVRCVRVVDAATRRLPLQKKVGAGLTAAEFEAQKKTGRFGHIGMRESVGLLARGLGFEVDEITQTLEPVLATEQRKTPFLTVESGQVAGIRNIGRGTRKGEVLIELDLSMFVGAPSPRDQIHIEGEPSVDLVFQGGIAGDTATAAILVNSIAQVVAATPGLKTVLDIAPPRGVVG